MKRGTSQSNDPPEKTPGCPSHCWWYPAIPGGRGWSCSVIHRLRQAGAITDGKDDIEVDRIKVKFLITWDHPVPQRSCQRRGRRW